MRAAAFIVAIVLTTSFAYPQATPTPAPPAAPRVTLGVPLTHSDWMLRDGVAWGPEGVRHMLDTCKAAGWNRVYWRALDGGRSLYASKLMDPQGKWDADNFWNPAAPSDVALVESWTGTTKESREELLAKLERNDYGSFDTLAEAVNYGHSIGLEIHAWISINEDDHGWGLQSRFSREHQNTVWRKRDGSAYRSQHSFAFPEVMDYKLAIVREILTKYKVDGIFVDWLRTGDVRDNPQTDADGVADHGYEAPLIEGFKAKFGVDPAAIPNGDERWVAYRARPHTEYMRKVRDLVNEIRPGIPISALVVHPWCYRGSGDKIDGNLRGMLLDVSTWAKEGLIDAAVPAGYYQGEGNADKAFQALRDETGGTINTWYFGWVSNSPEQFLNDVKQSGELGASQLLLWEADYIDGFANRDEMLTLMREHGK